MSWGTAISVGGALAGGLLNRNSDDAWANQQGYDNYWRQKNFDEARRQFDVNYARSNRYLVDRVQDARNAGLHPLFALGAGSANYSPTITAGAGGPGYDGRPSHERSGIGAGLAEAAGHLGSWMDKRTARKLGKEHTTLDLRLKRAQVEKAEAEALMAHPEGHAFTYALGANNSHSTATGRGGNPFTVDVPRTLAMRAGARGRLPEEVVPSTHSNLLHKRRIGGYDVDVIDPDLEQDFLQFLTLSTGLGGVAKAEAKKWWNRNWQDFKDKVQGRKPWR